jgi:2-polyprenyl-6-methoxyphenol hydroxylase-like FAD-dependent oxidoreductase
MTTRILVVGAGIGGLTAALALLRYGFEVVVLEQARELGEIGAGLQLSPNATRALFRLGLQSDLERIASEPAGKQVRLWNTGQAWKLFDLGAVSVETYGYPYLMLYRPDLQAVLADAVRKSAPDSIRLDARCVGLRQTMSGVVVELGDGEHVEGDALIGADGVHSAMRRLLFGADAPRFSGCMAWRGVIPAERLPEALRQPIGVNWVGPGGHVIQYPLRGGALVNFVGIVERDDWQRESWTEPGSVEECLHDFAAWHDDVRSLIRAIDTPYKWALMVREPIARWTVDRVALLGDACHPTLPFLAQGAAMAIEDGYIVARTLAGRPDIDGALRRYEQLRLDRTAKIVRGSAANAARFHNPVLADAQGAARYVDREWREDAVRERYDWLFRYDVDAVDLGTAPGRA